MQRTVAGFIALALAGLVALLAIGVPAHASAAQSPARTSTRAASSHAVIVIGISGLRWSDISAAGTPAIWRLAESGSVGSLVTTTIHPATCPADAWLTLNSGARAAERPSRNVVCPPVPVITSRPDNQTAPAQAVVQALPGRNGLISYNARFSYRPFWGVLARAAAGQCATAIGPGAALALANPAGRVWRFLPTLPGARRSAVLGQCPLTVLDLGALPAPTARVAGIPRGSAVAADDRAVGQIVGAAPAGSIIVLAGLGDDGSPHLRVIVVSGPGYRSGLLSSDSTRQPGIVAITDLTPAIFGWRGIQVPAPPSGVAPLADPNLRALSRSAGSLPAVVRTMIGQDAADQVYRSIVGWFFLYYGIGEAVLFGLIALAFRGSAEDRVRRRVAWYTAAAAFAAAVPAGTFLAGLEPWGQFSHPAWWLYGLGFAWAAVIAVLSVAGPWRRDPFGPPGFVGAATLAVIGIDVMTGSRLQLGAPFGLSLVEAGRFYGIGNNALAIYAVAGILTAAWAAVALLRRGGPDARRRALIGTGLVALVTVFVAGWPGFGAKVGGTIAIVPAFLVLLAAVAGIRITWRRGLIIAASGLVVVAVFALIDYLRLAAPSHQGIFVGQALHGSAVGTLQRKITSNLRSLFEAWFTPVVPVVAVGTGLMLGSPAKLRLRTFIAACERSALLRPSLFAVWLAVVLGWFAEDSGVSVAASALPIALPLAIALVVRTANLPTPVARPAAASGEEAGTQDQRVHGARPSGRYLRPGAGSTAGGRQLICAVPGNSVIPGKMGNFGSTGRTG